MSYVLKDLQPAEVFKYFEKLSEIPRGSGNEKEVSDYLVSFAKNNNLEVIQDEALNVVIRKKATPEYENSPTVIIQGHMDMVCEKNVGTEHDFTKDPLNLRVVDDMIYATGTTLGADNGIAVAMGLAILASNDIVHPALELVVTTEEETGMGGAIKLDSKNIQGRMLINIDSEEEGTLLVSCAGGVTTRTVIPAIWEETDKNLTPCAIRVRGLKGGHSGMEIDKGRANSNKLMARILLALSSEVDFRISSLNGGSKHNAIPREMDTIILINSADKTLVKNKIAELEKIFKNEFRTPDPDIRLEFEALTEVPDKMLSKQTTADVINFLYLVPNGVNSMNMDIKGLVESSANLGVVATNETEIEFITSIRSSIKSLKQEIYDRIVTISKLIGAEVTTESDYPEWRYNPDSKLRTIFEDVYNKMYGKMPHITAIHAGLECGLFEEKLKGDIDMISFGPNMYDVHTPDEHMSISSVHRTWDYLLEILKNIK
ncbi:aminoacyl-histidine dipeptidase [Clostridium sp. DJ247]|uniref:aminoacyl-histidine dipeptidase n=1 Tax=Clostridium sp. DJ247 TaxID=2726188 RepID=UPI001626AC46|nr:aminoacyl-histidine dipeptidase [Clostridium sp. DJ247]MBC2579343.1 aminoacyl-histidine dipeptidase [Clostridium sp. DJ247]